MFSDPHKTHRNADSVKQGGDTRYYSSATDIPTALPCSFSQPAHDLTAQWAIVHRGQGSSQTPPEKWFSNYSSAGRHVSLICARGRRSTTGDRCTQFAAAPPAIWILRQPSVLTMRSSIRNLISATLTDTRTACPSVRHQNV